ncbi:MAG: Sir2 family NAD-dependent protein deacetylase [Myxococcales bacterium]
MDANQIDRAATAVRRAQGLLVSAGAGMGVDSGLPDFRGTEAFWESYPAFGKLRLDLAKLSNSNWFHEQPELAWGFYGHRLRLYRDTEPHPGFALLRKWMEARPKKGFVFTSNLDGHFQKAGFDEEQVYEVHGSVHWAQCEADCGAGIFPVTFDVPLDWATMRAHEVPRCPACGGLARPNVLMTGDRPFDDGRSSFQALRFHRWFESIDGELTIVELGAGHAVPTVRQTDDKLAESPVTTLIRINPAEPQVPQGHIGIAAGALEALLAIDAVLGSTEPRDRG